MNRLLVPAALALALAASVAVAQNPTPPAPGTPPPDGQRHFHHHPPNPQREAEHIGNALNLSPEQTAKLTPIFASRDEQMKALWQNQQLAPQDKHQQMHAIDKSTHEQLATVLSPEQLQQLRTMHHEHGEHGHHGPPPPPPAA